MVELVVTDVLEPPPLSEVALHPLMVTTFLSSGRISSMPIEPLAEVSVIKERTE